MANIAHYNPKGEVAKCLTALVKAEKSSFATLTAARTAYIVAVRTDLFEQGFDPAKITTSHSVINNLRDALSAEKLAQILATDVIDLGEGKSRKPSQVEAERKALQAVGPIVARIIAGIKKDEPFRFKYKETKTREARTTDGTNEQSKGKDTDHIKLATGILKQVTQDGKLSRQDAGMLLSELVSAFRTNPELNTTTMQLEGIADALNGKASSKKK